MLELNRRDFIKKTGISTVGLAVSFQVPLSGRRAIAKPDNKPFTHHYFVVGTELNEYSMVMDKAEMGQGVITGQVTLFCEELDIKPEQLKVIPASVNSIYGTLAGMQITGGSTSTKDRWMVLRQTGANLRGAFLRAAAQKWSVNINELKIENGFVFNKDNSKKISYNELSLQVSLDKLPQQKLKEPSQFKYIGKKIIKKDAYEKSMGLASYGIDVQIKNSLVAVLLRCPSFGGKIKSFDSSEALKIKGIKHVIKTSRGVAIVGDKYWQVKKARDFVNVTWDLGENNDISNDNVHKKYFELFKKESGKRSYEQGDFKSVFDKNKDAIIVSANYEFPYLAHAPMEPMNALADVKDNKADIWTGTQAPTSLRGEVADFLNMNRESVEIHNMKYLGGGFGRRSSNEYVLEAVEISAQLKVPVKVIWSREDDTQFSPMRPISSHSLTGLVKDGKPIAWEHKLGCESIMQQFLPQMVPQTLPEWLPELLRKGAGAAAGGITSMLDFHMVTSEGSQLSYNIPNQNVDIYSQNLNLPILFWRSVGHSYNGFIVETFIDEMAFAAQTDPYDFRKDLLVNQPRLLGVLNEVAKMSDWKNKKGRNLGIACHASFESFVAEVAEVEVINSEIKVKKVYCAVDCGIAVNPEIVKDQMESGIIYGLSAALYGQLTIRNGGVQQTNFHDYPVLRFGETPEIEVSILSSNESPTGVGEPGLPPIAPAVANAVFSLTGKRLRKMPLKLS